MEIAVLARHTGLRGKSYEIRARAKKILVLVTFHALGRIERWQLTEIILLRTLLFPEEVLRGHHGRFIAHRRLKDHVVRVVYEYEGSVPVVITVYNPLAERYFQGGGIYEDQILG